MVAALSRHGIGRAGEDGRSPQIGSRCASGDHRRTDRTDAAFDPAWSEGLTGGVRRKGLAQRCVAVLAPGKPQFQKKPVRA